MSRLTGPRLKKMRALLEDLPGLSSKSIERRPYPPGQHGQSRRKESEFSRRLHEKQKLRFHYGLTEKQLRIVFRDAQSSKTATGTRFLELLESRLDNVVFRAGFTATIPAARQLIRHGHVLLNGKRASIPSIRLRSGDTVTIVESARPRINFDARRHVKVAAPPEWLVVDKAAFSSKLTAVPSAASVPLFVDVQLVVEFYARSA